MTSIRKTDAPERVKGQPSRIQNDQEEQNVFIPLLESGFALSLVDVIEVVAEDATFLSKT